MFGERDNHILPVQKLNSINQMVNAFEDLDKEKELIRSDLMSFIPGYSRTIVEAVEAVRML